MSVPVVRKKRPFLFLGLTASCIAALLIDRSFPGIIPLKSGLTLPAMLSIFLGVLALSDLAGLFTNYVLARKNKPLVEGKMIGRLYKLVAVLAIGMGLAYGLGALATIGSFFALFGGMLLGWSLQAPVSGFAAYLLVSLKRPFRPGDRVQFPNLGLTGDVKDTGPMYTILDQVGGSIGSEEAVGRHILVPNALLFSQVVINYTVLQEAAFMLDEVVVRITYDSDWEASEKLLLAAARELTADVIAATGVDPYIRSDLYDYGVYLRLRYQTRVKNRAETAYRITKNIFKVIQQDKSIDLAIPFVYSYRAGADRRDDLPREKAARNIKQISVAAIHPSPTAPDARDIDQLSKSIANNGLLQPVMVIQRPDGENYDIIAGELRFHACKKLGWQTVPAVVLPERGDASRTGTGAVSDSLS